MSNNSAFIQFPWRKLLFMMAYEYLFALLCINPCYTSLCLPALAPGCSLHQVQDTDACIKTATGSAPAYLHSLMTIYISSRSLKSAITERHKISLQNVFIHRSWLVDNFQATPENSSLPSSLDYFFILTPPPPKKHLCSLSLTSSCLASVCSEQCLKCCITSTSCDCSPLYNVSLIAFLNCKSLWIKVSAKLINVNVNNSDHCCTIASSELLFYVLL